MKARFAAAALLLFSLAMSAVPETVYITKSGDKYHTTNCRYVKKSKIAVDRAEAVRLGKSPCKVCKP